MESSEERRSDPEPHFQVLARAGEMASPGTQDFWLKAKEGNRTIGLACGLESHVSFCSVEKYRALNQPNHKVPPGKTTSVERIWT